MNLYEDIQRIKQVMGINETVMTDFKRRIPQLPMYVKSAYSFLNARNFDSFDEFLNRVVFTTTRDFIQQEFDPYEYYYGHIELAQEIIIYVRSYINKYFLEDIKDYYNNYK